MKKILLIIAITLCIFQMVVLATAIDVGSEATNRGDKWYQNTFVDQANPANASGKIISIEIWACAGYDITGLEVATFSASGNNLATRDYESIPGTITSGSKSTVLVTLDSDVIVPGIDS